MNHRKSNKLYHEAIKYFPGGVNSPVRAFRAVGGTPLFIEKGDGCYIWDADGNRYVDFCCSWGPLILGHNHPAVRKKLINTLKKGTSFGAPTALENELAELILSNNPFIDKIRFVSSGTEAVMSAIRLARGFTGRSKIIKFDGCYHGHADSLLVKAGSGLATFGISSSAGVPVNFANETIVLPLNDIEAVEKTFIKFKNQIACVIIEPVPANNGLLLQDKKFLQGLCTLCKKNNALVIFDEVITGFRLGFAGAAGLFNIKPDLITYGKIIGGGLPVGAYGGKKEIMSRISPDGDVYQAGTLSGNPIAMAAGIATLTQCLKPGFYEKLNNKMRFFSAEFYKRLKLQNPYYTRPGIKLISTGSIFWFAFTDKDNITRPDEIDPYSKEIFKKFYRELLRRNIYIGPSGYEVGFISASHTDQTLSEAAAGMAAAAIKSITSYKEK